MVHKPLKKPEDYPTFIFRIPAEKKLEINKMVAEIIKNRNRDLEASERKFRKNHVIIEALEIGLKKMMDKY